jgi:hypothetical protein
MMSQTGWEIIIDVMAPLFLMFVLWFANKRDIEENDSNIVCILMCGQ